MLHQDPFRTVVYVHLLEPSLHLGRGKSFSASRSSNAGWIILSLLSSDLMFSLVLKAYHARGVRIHAIVHKMCEGLDLECIRSGNGAGTPRELVFARTLEAHEHVKVRIPRKIPGECLVAADENSVRFEDEEGIFRNQFEDFQERLSADRWFVSADSEFFCIAMSISCFATSWVCKMYCPGTWVFRCYCGQERLRLEQGSDGLKNRGLSGLFLSAPFFILKFFASSSSLSRCP